MQGDVIDGHSASVRPSPWESPALLAGGTGGGGGFYWVGGGQGEGVSRGGGGVCMSQPPFPTRHGNAPPATAYMGPLMGAGVPKCRMSILRNGNVTCLCRLFSIMSHVEFTKRLCCMSLYI